MIHLCHCVSYSQFTPDALQYDSINRPEVNNQSSNLGESLGITVSIQNNGPSIIYNGTINIYIPARAEETGEYYYYYPASFVSSYTHSHSHAYTYTHTHTHTYSHSHTVKYIHTERDINRFTHTLHTQPSDLYIHVHSHQIRSVYREMIILSTLYTGLIQDFWQFSDTV